MQRIIILSLFSFLITLSVSSAKELKIGYVNLQEAILSVEKGKKAKNSLEADYNIKKKELETMENDLKNLKNTLEKQGMILSEESRRKKEDEYKRLLLEFQQKFATYQKDIQQKEMELTGDIVKDLKVVIEKVALEGGFSLVLEKSDNGVLYGLPEMDLTNDVIKRFNKINK